MEVGISAPRDSPNTAFTNLQYFDDHFNWSVYVPVDLSFSSETVHMETSRKNSLKPLRCFWVKPLLCAAMPGLSNSSYVLSIFSSKRIHTFYETWNTRDKNVIYSVWMVCVDGSRRDIVSGTWLAQSCSNSHTYQVKWLSWPQHRIGRTTDIFDNLSSVVGYHALGRWNGVHSLHGTLTRELLNEGRSFPAVYHPCCIGSHLSYSFPVTSDNSNFLPESSSLLQFTIHSLPCKSVLLVVLPLYHSVASSYQINLTCL